LFCYQTTAGTNTSTGIFWTPETLDVGYPVATMNMLAYITTPTANVTYGINTASGVTAFTAVNATVGPSGPGNAVASNAIATLASLSDIDIYVSSFLIAGGTTVANTGGTYAVLIEYTGLEG
jgi:hypothetical protein